MAHVQTAQDDIDVHLAIQSEMADIITNQNPQKCAIIEGKSLNLVTRHGFESSVPERGPPRPRSGKMLHPENRIKGWQ